MSKMYSMYDHEQQCVACFLIQYDSSTTRPPIPGLHAKQSVCYASSFLEILSHLHNQVSRGHNFDRITFNSQRKRYVQQFEIQKRMTLLNLRVSLRISLTVQSLSRFPFTRLYEGPCMSQGPCMSHLTSFRVDDPCAWRCSRGFPSSPGSLVSPVSFS